MIAAALTLAAGLAGAAAWQEQEIPRARPEQEHDFLKNYVGEWDFTQSMRMSPADPWMEIQGTQTGRLVGDLWLLLEWKSDLEGAPMTGIGLVGYDPKKEKFVSTFVDSMHTAMASGEATLERRTLTTEVSTTDPKTGKPAKTRVVERVTGKDSISWEMYGTDKEGREYQCGKGESTRRK